MRIFTVISFFVMFFFGLFVELVAQEAPPVVPGARVRISAPTINVNRFVGTVVKLNTDTLFLSLTNQTAPQAISFISVKSLEVSRGRKSKRGQGALIGLALGAGIGYLSASSGANNPQAAEPKDFYYKTRIPAFALYGSGIGALIGWATKVERWQAIPLDRVRLGFLPP